MLAKCKHFATFPFITKYGMLFIHKSLTVFVRNSNNNLTNSLISSHNASSSNNHQTSSSSKHRSRRRRDRSEVSCCLKYVIFGFNIIFWLLGFSILGTIIVPPTNASTKMEALSWLFPANFQAFGFVKNL